MEFFQEIFGLTGLVIWEGIIILSLLIAVIVLALVLFNKEKTLQLAQFTLSPVGIKLTYEIDRDEKIKLLVAENILLKKEVDVLKGNVRRLNLSFLAFTIITFIALALFAVRAKLHFRKNEEKSEDKTQEKHS